MMTPQPLRNIEVIEAAIKHIPEGGTLIVPNVSWQGYVESPTSRAFPFLTSDALTKAIEQCRAQGQGAALRSL